MHIDPTFWEKHLQPSTRTRVLVREQSHTAPLPPLLQVDMAGKNWPFHLLHLSPNLAMIEAGAVYSLAHQGHPASDYYVRLDTYRLFDRLWFPQGFDNIQTSPWVTRNPYVVHIALPELRMFLFQVRVSDPEYMLSRFYPEQFDLLGVNPKELLLYTESSVRNELITHSRRTLYAWETPIKDSLTATNFISKLASRMARSFGGHGRSLFQERALRK